ncbi:MULTISPECIES: 16S rRNA (guanine(527)-N(7))-methyltransferase RsmG [Pseudothermotoga]|jgi:16S rRNA (guanine527-N7)-methyltransferase|uniref:Ribosomal RNA small subunit methyltransferase G n=1 Tax=Pseudothermotoga lettingae (strain ATCC BAA-301 / DSM 14385 / NBRC 107922 / TMO) TaxID=416591 RepID=RSMG_PSELT|nr:MULTISPECIES: 16S rRNA (guanine(527)-N(7))-methyltransferase RsmG [Pseudothermotoga]A8F3S3.1 RecName: Full=Ribosomal RNA small subunit methyltransferase G; AltName: Full=16S rRNA 7-methylguanosine methyltransferase; Short=16S rRNA m7G methyltransferase [Pseudothermotoga lettingae TMO]ABV32807.1 methyltransferase GidB [Pseudothermotoga lettingae TMO]MDI3495138.1 rRNA (guanine527-N7)-methyltransferase [Pseudothermotoga sp.]MDK2885182.1 rRNA (guanine527-N7)-methyltransferase [Pseudothermotoga s
MNKVAEIFREYGIKIDDSKTEKLDSYIDLLISAPINLTSLRDKEYAIHKHIVDIVFPVKMLTGKLLDVGTGGGIPGLILAILFPINATLVESVRKKVMWLEKILNMLNIGNVNLLCSRAEKLPADKKESFDIVTARAVSELRILLELCAPFCKVGGRLFFYKGPNWKQEYDAAHNAMKTLNVETIEIVSYTLKTGEKRVLLQFQKVGRTPDNYPRETKKILKNPL